MHAEFGKQSNCEAELSHYGIMALQISNLAIATQTFRLSRYFHQWSISSTFTRAFFVRNVGTKAET